VLGGRSAKSQAVATVDLIQAALKALGSSLPDVVKTRCLLRHAKDYEEVAAVHSWAFSCVGIRPATSSVIGGLTSPESLVEMEAEAVVGSGAKGTLKVFIAS
jgi:enamine deaminase RidA (YjgF/YER057c/UK114 family)